MPYSTKSDIESKIPADFLKMIADLDDDGEADSKVVENAIGEADAEIDGRLEENYTVPFAAGSVPESIRWISCWLAIESMAISRGIGLEDGWVRKIDAKKEALNRYADGTDAIPGITVASNYKPTRVYPTALPEFTTNKFDIDGSRVNTDEVEDGDLGTLDAL